MRTQDSFQHLIQVSGNDIDALHHVNNVVYLRYAQEVAEAHWLLKGTEELRQQYAWVVLRHEIDYLSPSLLNQYILGTTWIESPIGPKVIRHVELFNKSVQRLSAKVKTTWCLLDATSLKPKRIDEAMIRVFK